MPVFARITLEDPSLPHQIRIRVGSNNQDCQVSCNCRPAKSFGEAPFTNLGAIWRLYDIESNHWHGNAPFRAGDRTPKETIQVW